MVPTDSPKGVARAFRRLRSPDAFRCNTHSRPGEV